MLRIVLYKENVVNQAENLESVLLSCSMDSHSDEM